MNTPPAGVWIGVVIPAEDSHACELLGDAADLADRLGGRVTACTASTDPQHHRQWIAHGADHVAVLDGGDRGLNQRLHGAAMWHERFHPRVVFASASGDDRALAARLAVRRGARLVSPALCVAVRRQSLEVTGLNSDGRRARQVTIDANTAVIVTLRPGVGQPRTPRHDRTGEIQHLTVAPQSESVTVIERRPADPATTDIVHLPRLVAGGRGLGGQAGFDLLRQVAARLDAGVAASRMAVDLGWIERERQVGQTGKTVQPELYLAVGISGASHHREGMADSRHIVALNHDPQAPIFQIAHLGLAADWHATLRHLLELTEPKSNS